MPTYVYRCLECDTRFEVQQAFTDDALTSSECANCGRTTPVKKVFTPVGVTFKGSGFYKTDSRSGSSKSAGSSSSDSSSSGSTSSTSSSTSSDSSSSSGGGSSTSSSGSGSSGSSSSGSDKIAS
jgi:putative FmdB family regulatory protein